MYFYIYPIINMFLLLFLISFSTISICSSSSVNRSIYPFTWLFCYLAGSPGLDMSQMPDATIAIWAGIIAFAQNLQGGWWASALWPCVFPSFHDEYLMYLALRLTQKVDLISSKCCACHAQSPPATAKNKVRWRMRLLRKLLNRKGFLSFFVFLFFFVYFYLCFFMLLSFSLTTDHGRKASVPWRAMRSL